MGRKPAALLFLVLAAALGWPAGASAHGANTRIDAGPSGTIFTDSATFEFSSPLDGGFQCRLDSHDWRDWEWCESPQTYSSLADGSHRFEVRALNRPGHPDPTPASRSFEVETEPPDTAITAAPEGTIAAVSASFGFESNQPGSFQCRLDSSDEADWEPCVSPQPYGGLAQGPHSFEVRAVNEGDNADPTPASAIFAVDSEAPETSLIGPPLATISVDSASFSFEASEEGTAFECRLDSEDEADWEPCTSPVSYTGLAPGAHVFEVRAIDAVGNVDPTPAVDDFSFHPPQPIVALASIPPGHPKPVAGESVNLELVSGVVELRCPGEEDASRLVDFKQVPLGCLINTRNGVVDLTASKGSSGDVQTATFWGGVFITEQEAGDDKIVDLKLAGRRMCERRGQGPHGPVTGPRRSRPMAVRARGKGGGRKLWGSGKGDYKTSGSYGSATVRGTTWLVVDRCDSSTLIKVGEGTVWARDFVKDKTIVLTTGEQYLAKAAIPRLNLDNVK